MCKIHWKKAYAKLNFNYSSLTKITLRQAVNEFTGLEPEILTFTKGFSMIFF